MKKNLIALLIVIVIVVIGIVGGSFYYYQTNKKTTPTPVVVENKVSDLQTYTNSDYGYSFQYPKDYSVGMQAASMVVRKDTDGVTGQWTYSIGAWKNSDKSLTDFVNRIIDDLIARPRASGIPLTRSDIDISDTTIGGNPAKEIIVKNNGDYGNAVAVTIYGDNISLQVWGDASTPENEIDFNNFLKTFKLNVQDMNQYTITDNDLADLKVAIKEAEPEYVASLESDYVVKINQQEGRYISATLDNGKPLISFPGFWAYKADDGWKIVYGGDFAPNCSDVNKYNFPKDMISGCFDGKSIIDR